MALSSGSLKPYLPYAASERSTLHDQEEVARVGFDVVEAEADPEELFAELACLADEEETSEVFIGSFNFKFDREPRGTKPLAHLRVLRTSDPCHGSLAPSRDRPSHHEVSYDPYTRWNVLGKYAREARGVKSLKDVETLRTSDPTFGSLAPSRDRPSHTEVSYDPLTRWNVLGKHLREPRGHKSEEHIEILRTSNPCYGSLAPSRDRPSKHEESYDPLTRWNAVAKNLRVPRGAKSAEHLEILRTSDPCYGSLAPSRDHPSHTEVSYDPIARWVFLAPLLREPRGAKSAEHVEILRTSDPCYGSLAPSRDRPSHTELSWDPLVRWVAMSPLLRGPRGAKSKEHLDVLRTSDPTFGSLTPSRDRPSHTEVSYDPLTRWNVLGKHLREPRGAKSKEHLDVLRTSDPTFGSLTPSRDRPSHTEVSYDPLTRWNVLGKYTREPRGAKSEEHLQILRTSDPSLSSLAPSIWKLLPLLKEGTIDFSTLERLRALRASGGMVVDGTKPVAAPVPSMVVPLDEGGWRLLQPAKRTFNFDSFDEYTDDESSESGDGISELPDGLVSRRQRNSERNSNTSMDSERSNARTMERMSNDSVASMLDDDLAELGDVPFSPKRPDVKTYTPQVPNPLAGWRVR